MDVRVAARPSGGSLRLEFLNDEGTGWEDASMLPKKPLGVEGALAVDGDFRQLLSQFAVVAEGWTTLYPPLSFSFCYFLGVGEEDRFILVKDQAGRRGEVMLPMGAVRPPSDVRTVGLDVVVTDAFGASTTFVYEFPVVVDGFTSTEAARTLGLDAENADWRTRPWQSRWGAELPTAPLRRHLSQEEAPTPEQLTEAEEAGALKLFLFDPAVASQETPRILQFLDLWGRIYGKASVQYHVVAACANVNPALKALKGDIVRALTTTDQTTVLSADFVGQFACSVSRVTPDPGGMSASAQASLLGMLRHNMLIPVLENYYQYNVGFAVPRVALTVRAAECYSDYINDALRAAQAACDLGGERNQTMMDELYVMVEDLGVAIAQTRTPGQEAMVVDGQYVTLGAKRSARRAEGDTTRTADVDGLLVGGSMQEELFGFTATVTEEAVCLEDPNVVCGDRLTPDDPLDVVYYVYKFGSHSREDPDYINPLPVRPLQ